MKLIKENKVLFLLAVIIIVCIVVMGIALIKYFYSGNGDDAYGSRLDGIEEVKISDDINTKVEDILKENAAFNEVVVNVKGKVIYINIDLKTSLSLVAGQSLAIKSLDAFSEEEKAFYDIQLIVDAKNLEEESSLYPYMGYKSAKGTQVIWTNTK